MKKIIALLCCISILSGCFRMVREDGKPYQKLVKEAYVENVPAKKEEVCSAYGYAIGWVKNIGSGNITLVDADGSITSIWGVPPELTYEISQGQVANVCYSIKDAQGRGSNYLTSTYVDCGGNCKTKVVAKAKKVKHEAQYKTAIPYTCKQKFDVPITAISLLLTWGIATLVCGVMMFDEKCPSMLNDPRCTKAGRFEEIKEIK